jgi:hypothetical protein
MAALSPRNISGLELVKALRVFGDERLRQDGSLVRLTTALDGGYHVTAPNRAPLRLGTFTTAGGQPKR